MGTEGNRENKLSYAGDKSETANRSIIDLSSDTHLSVLVNNVHGSNRYNIIKNYILNELANQPIVLSDGKSAFVDKSDAKHIANRAGDKKVAEISKIKKIIENAVIVAYENSTDKTDKFSKYFYYQTFVKFNDTVFSIYVNVGLTKNDKTYHIYDLTEKLRDTAHRVNDVGRLSKSFALKNSISTVSLSDSDENVNRFSEKDLSEKYPTLNLNQDISNLDGVPAIKLVDGSVLPLDEFNGRRMLHIEFIQKRRIDFEDIQSGGWIGKGEYEPSFTSDTQRFIEQMKAKKKVAELTHKNFDQFENYSFSAKSTADSQKALDVERRLDYTAEKRKNTRPDIDRTDVVFSDGNVSYSLMNNKTLKENITDIVHMNDKETLKRKKAGEYIEVLSYTPSVILDNVKDAKNIKVIIRFDAAYLATRHSGILEGHYHNYGEDFADKLVSVLNNPNAIIRLKNGRLNLLGTVETIKGNDNIVSVELNTVKDVNSEYKAYNLIVSMLPAKSNYIKNLIIKQAKKIEYEKEDLSQVNPQLHKSLSIINDKSSVNNISDSDENVNRFSEKDSGKAL